MAHTGTGKRPRKPSSQAEQQRSLNSAGTLLLMAENKARGSPWLLWPEPFGLTIPREVQRNCLLPLSQAWKKPKRWLGGCKAWIRACGRPHDQILDQHTWSAFARPACQARGWNRDVYCHLTHSYYLDSTWHQHQNQEVVYMGGNTHGKFVHCFSVTNVILSGKLDKGCEQKEDWSLIV